MIDGSDARLVETARSGDRRALAALVERCEPLVGHLVGYGLAGHPDPGGVAREVMQHARRGALQIGDPAGVRAWIAARALWQVRHLRQPGHLGAAVDGLGLTGEARRIAEAARRLTPEDRDTFALLWLCAAGALAEAEAGQVLGVVDAAYYGRRMLARLDAARTVLAAITAAPACPAQPAVAASLDPDEFLNQSRHVQGCPTCARHGGTLQPAMPVLAAAGPVRLPGEALSAGSPALLPPPRRPPAPMALSASAEVTAVLSTVTESAEVTAVLSTVTESSEVTTRVPVPVPVPVPSAAVTRAPEVQTPARRRTTVNRRVRQLGLAALAVLILGVVVANLPGNPVLGPLAGPSPTGAAGTLTPTGPATVVDAAVPGVPNGPGGVLPADPPQGPAALPAAGSASPAASGSRPATQPATVTPTAPPPATQPATLFSDDFESGSAAGWSKSGGAWNVVSDGGSRVLRQGNPTPGLSRVFIGDTGWADYSLQAQVKPLAFGSPGLVGVTARAGGVATYYRLALTSDGRAVLQAYAGSNSITTLASTSLRVTVGTWYALRIDVNGGTITGYVNGQRIGSGAGTLAGSGRIGLQTNLATAEFDNVTVTAAA
jgi:hypothetical protein